MNCPKCGANVREGQRLCLSCGTLIDAPAVAADPDPVDEPVTHEPLIASLREEPETKTFQIVEQTEPVLGATWTSPWDDQPEPFDESSSWPPVSDGSTTAMPVTPGPYDTQMSPVIVMMSPARRAAQIVLGIIAIIAGAAIVVGAFLPVLQINTDAPLTGIGDYEIDKLALGDNLRIVMIVVAAVVVIAGWITVAGVRPAAGAIAGVGLAAAPFLIVIWSRLRLISNQAEEAAITLAASGGGGTYIETKPGVGFFVLLIGVGTALLAALIALVASGPEPQPPLNRALCALGALGGVVAAIGPLLPQNGASFSDNFDAAEIGTMFLGGRIGVITVVALASFVGFLWASRWGVVFAIAAAIPFAAQWLTSLASMTSAAATPAFGNPGNADGKPHPLTTAGLAVMLVSGVVALSLGARRRALH